MSSLLLTTKLHVPQVRTSRVLRPRLLARLQQGLAYKLILTSAPAGYGKTTLVCEWLAGYEQLLAWVSLDKDDNDPARFWSYVFTALQRTFSPVGKNLPEILCRDNLPINEAMITDLINELDKLQQPLILVLDDYHNIESQVIHDGMSFLLDHAPAHFHLVIATRADPPLPLARLRARSELLEMRRADLCFTTSEAADFLNHIMGLRISSDDVASLTARTEGWIAGLQMAALSMQNTTDVSGFVATLSGSHHYIFDYLLEEVLERQSPEIRRFLLYTSILDQFTAPLCDALLMEENTAPVQSAAIILEEIERKNLFIISLDHERDWYRYHSLFAELLHNYLGQKSANKIPTLHTRASLWFEKQGLIADSIHHALLAGNWERVVALISVNVFALLEQNELITVAKQLDHIANEEKPAHPWLWIGRAWLAAYTGKLDSLESILGAAESGLASLDNLNDQQNLRGHCAAIRAFGAWIAGRHAIAAQTAQQALDHLGEADFTIRCLAATVLGLSLPDTTARAQAFERALTFSSQCSVSHITFFAQGCWAYDLVVQGRLSEALEFCRGSLRLAQSNNTHQRLPTLSYVHATIAMILWQRNELNDSLHHAREAVALALRWEQADALHFAYTILGDTLFAVGAVEEAFGILQQAWLVAHRTSRWFEEINISQEVEWYLAQKKLDAALQRLHAAQINLEDDTQIQITFLLNLSIARIFLAQEKYDKALALLSFILKRLEDRKNTYHAVYVLAWQALAYYKAGKKTQAFASLKRAFTLAGSEIYIRHFALPDERLIPLLREARKAGIHLQPIDRLLTAFDREDKVQAREAGTGSGLIEPLSRREIDVMKLLGQGCTDKQIAETLIIARETVHKHLKNIYGKLGVHNRTEAVLRAQELSLF
jgi:ATP/maltotriose-dependent transcriptional regulator MalT